MTQWDQQMNSPEGDPVKAYSELNEISQNSPVSSQETSAWNTDINEPELTEEGYMVETHGGGSIENVPGFSAGHALTEGFSSDRIPIDDSLTSLSMAFTKEFDKPEDVCGNDDRKPITSTSSVPWRSICQLVIRFHDGVRVKGTGWFIGPRTVITAGHCVYSFRRKTWAHSIDVIPGMNADQRPFSSLNAKSFRSVNGWVQNGNVTSDYGCILLPNASLGNKVGWFGFSALNSQSLKNLLINNAGYPGDKDFGTLWFNSGRITSASQNRLSYMVDTFGGQSGSPIFKFHKNSEKRTVVGIHNYGGCPNNATRITREVFKNLQIWKNL